MGEYDPLLGASRHESDDLEQARDLFAAASRPHLVSPWPWVAWAVVLPIAALATPAVLAGWGPAGALAMWSLAILLAGAVELSGILRGRRRHAATPLASWVLSLQGNLSLVAVALSAALLWAELGALLPGLWLLVLGHSFYLLGGLAFPPFRLYGLLYQAGGVVALWPALVDPYLVLAAVTFGGNLWLAAAVARAARQRV